MTGPTGEAFPLGAWARAGELVGVVAAADADAVTLFDPGQRRMVRAARGEVTRVEAAALTVSLHVDLPVPHGLDEDTLVRWVASLADVAVRERAREALMEAGLDEGASLPAVRLAVEPASSGGAVCLCGARTPAPDGARVPCAACGRQAVGRPPRAGAGDVLGLG